MDKQCDKLNNSQLSDAVEKLESELKSLGYINVEINHFRINYTHGNTKGTINIMGTLGPKTEYLVTNNESHSILSKIFSTSETKGLSPDKVDPDAMEVELKKVFKKKDIVMLKFKRKRT